MPEKPAPKPDDDTYSHEETVRRREATIRAMIGMKPKPQKDSIKQRGERVSRPDSHQRKK